MKLDNAALPSSPRDRWLLLGLALLIGCVPLLAAPFTEAGFNDDWSYSRMAFEVARTGTFHYDGWATAAVGPLAYWGALFVKCFGPSYFALRCSTLILSGGCVPLIYAIARACGLGPSLARQSAAAAMLSPLLIPLSASFMTDVPAMFVSLAALTCAIALLRSNHPRYQTFWLILFLLLGLLGGQIRQVVWLLDLAVAPALIWLARPARSIAALWIVLWLIAAAAVAEALHRLGRQPYFLDEGALRSLALAVREPLAVSRRAAHLFTTSAWLLTPIGIGFFPLIRRVPRWIFIVAGLLTLLEVVPFGLMRNPAYLTPWVGNLITDWGILPEQTDMLGARPRIFSIAFSALLLSWSLLLLNAGLGAAIVYRKGLLRTLPGRFAHPVRGLLLVYFIVTLLLSVMRPQIIFDRYFISLLPIAIIGLLSLRQRWIGPRPSGISTGLILAGLVFGLAITFDYHASLRARLAALAETLNTGVPRCDISAGLELDAQTQLDVFGFINDDRLSFPPVYQPLVPNRAWTAARFHLWPAMPAIRPLYVVSRSPLIGYDPTDLPPITYWTCFPPFRRAISVLQLAASLRQTPANIIAGKPS